MFKNDVIEFFSRVHWTIPLLLFLPIISIFLYYALMRHRLDAITTLALYAAGLFFWSITEYILHRFVFHYEPKTEWGRKFHWTFHGVHHDYPSDPLRLVMVPAVSLPLGAVFYLLFVAVMGYNFAAAFAPGFFTGYLFYDISHYAIHHFPLKGKFFGKMREHHMRHHYADPNNGFGVSSAMWDKVFRTTFDRSANLQPTRVRETV